LVHALLPRTDSSNGEAAVVAGNGVIFRLIFAMQKQR
jgi:hypothetical protein